MAVHATHCIRISNNPGIYEANSVIFFVLFLLFETHEIFMLCIRKKESHQKNIFELWNTLLLYVELTNHERNSLRVTFQGPVVHKTISLNLDQWKIYVTKFWASAYEYLNFVPTDLVWINKCFILWSLKRYCPLESMQPKQQINI